MRIHAFEKQIVKLGQLLSRDPPSSEEKEENQEKTVKTSENKPQIEDTETKSGRRGAVRSIEQLRTCEQEAIARTLRRLKEAKCSFRTIKSGTLKICWIIPPDTERYSRVSVPHPDGFRKLLRQAGIKPR